jgi:hypothetical protein
LVTGEMMRAVASGAGEIARGEFSPAGFAVPSVCGILAGVAADKEKLRTLPGSGATFLILLHFPVFSNFRVGAVIRWVPAFSAGRLWTTGHDHASRRPVGVLVRDSDIATGRSASVWSEI